MKRTTRVKLTPDDVLFGFLSITLSFSTAAWWMDGLRRTYRRRKLLKSAQPA
ncbi:MAG: hypothetical protein ABIG45_03725 [Bacillota bacterium]